MLKEIQFQRGKQRIYAMDNNYKVIDSWECRSDFVPGCNTSGLPRESLPIGTYPCIRAEISKGAYGPSYGTFYITTGDPRGRDIHGGGAGLAKPFAAKQGWVPTYGCLRMQNEDGEDLCRLINTSNNDVVLTVVE